MVYFNVSRIRRGLHMLPHYLIEGNDVQATTLQRLVKGTKNEAGKYVGGRGYSGFTRSLRDSMLSAEKAANGAYAASGGNALKYLKNAFSKIPGELADGWKAGGAKVAKDAGKMSKFFGSLKGLGKAIGKRMPFIGTALYALTTIPNIIRATVEGGIGTGVGEVLKTGASLTGFTAGCAIGQALIPIPLVGGLIGGLIGGVITDKIVGKSYTEKKAELEQKAMEKAQAQLQQGFDTGSTNPFAHLTPEQQYQLAMMQQQQS